MRSILDLECLNQSEYLSVYQGKILALCCDGTFPNSADLEDNNTLSATSSVLTKSNILLQTVGTIVV